MADIAIRVTDLSKRYRIGLKDEMHDTLGGAVADFATRPLRNLRRLRSLSRFGDDDSDAEGVIWALNQVSFDVRQGEIVGIIGRNGAGKTTLLRILSGITDPTSGRAEVNGRVSALLEVGTGFHPELTGRENIYLNGAILGMKKAEIDRKFDEIVAFSEIERFLDTPVKRYSSGMTVRLAFSVAAHLEPEILIVDEVLAVGDAKFQDKCMGKMEDVTAGGRTILFVSHHMTRIERLCDRAILLDEGRIIEDAQPKPVIASYLGPDSQHVAERVWTDPEQMPHDDVVRIRAVRTRRTNGDVSGEFAIQEPIDVEMEIEVLESGHVIETDFYFHHDGGVLAFLAKDYHGNPWANAVRPAGVYREVCHIPGDLLNEGTYTVSAGSTTPPFLVHAVERDAIAFRVVDDFGPGARGGMSGDWPGGVVRPLLHWTVEHSSTDGS